MELMATCTLGLEGAVSRELKMMGYKILDSENGRIRFKADLSDIPRLNIWIRSAERILLVVGKFEALSFDDLFDGVSSLPWEDFIPKDGRFPIVKVRTAKSVLFAKSAIQSIVKKAIVNRLSKIYGITIFPENGSEYPVYVYLRKNVVTVSLDTTGRDGLHKRGYRKMYVEAPLRETIAAALLILSGWNREKNLVDPFCGSGTICIEAGMMAGGIAPGMNRNFVSMNWGIIPKKIWKEEFEKARSHRENSNEYEIIGGDVDEEAIKVAELNLRNLGVNLRIKFVNASFEKLRAFDESGIIVTNPPYGMRISGTIREIHRRLKVLRHNFPGWRYNIISPFIKFERMFGMKAKRRYSFFNSGVRVHFFQFW